MVWLIVFVLVCLLTLHLVKGSVRRGASSDWPVFRHAVISETEQVAFDRLCRALPDWKVLPQVAVGQFIAVRDVPDRRAVRNRFDRLSADFVVCGGDFIPQVAVELDDSSHDSPARRTRDAKKDAVLRAAGIGVMRVSVRFMPDVSGLREQFSKVLADSLQVEQRTQNVRPAAAKLPRRA